MSELSNGQLPCATDALRAEFERFRYELPDALVEVDIASGRVTYLNRVAELIFGYTAADVEAGLPGSALLSPRDRMLVVNRIEADRAAASQDAGHRRGDLLEVYELLMMRKDCSLFDAEVRTLYQLDDGGMPSGLRMIARDISSQRRSQAVRGLGTLAGDIAHEMSNVMTSMLGAASLVVHSDGLTPSALGGVQIIEEAAERGIGFAQQLQALSRSTSLVMAPAAVTGVLDDAARASAEATGGACRAYISLPQGRPTIVADRSQLVEALAGAIIAVHESARGGVLITASQPGAGDEVEIRIAPADPTADAGARRELLRHTVSLGLPIARQVVETHGGSLRLVDAIDARPAIVVRLPGRAATTPGPETGEPPEASLLIVDDDPMVRQAFARMAERLGARATSVEHGHEAIALVRDQPSRFGAIAVDLVMPGMSGVETIRAIRQLAPSVPVIIVTGYAAQHHIDEPMSRSIAEVMRKPFTQAELGAALSRAGLLAKAS
jgi:PAS domain S-box-containing protein